MTYWRYFIFHVSNWNIILAIFVLWHEWRGEKKYGIKTIGIDDLTNSVPEKLRAHASIYQPINYYTAEMLFNTLTIIDKASVFLDMGCGRGRVLVMAAHYGFTNIVGIDFSAKLCHEAITITNRAEDRFEGALIDVEYADAANYEISKQTGVLFLFNPFDDVVMVSVIRNVLQSLRDNPRPFKVLYANPIYKKMWIDAGFEEVSHFTKLRYLQGGVYEWKNE